MAATTTVSAWSKPGAWALDSEENEAELLKDAANPPPAVAAETVGDFPSLAAAAATKQKKKKKQSLSLAEFTNSGFAKPTPQASIGRTHEDLLVLPTGPRERSAEELDRSRLGGGFKNYGSMNGGGGRYGDSREDNSSRWGSSRGSDEPRRNRDSNRDREMAPSRADEIDNWAAAKKPIGSGNGFERRERGGFFSDSQSKADEVDSWVSNKTFTPSEGRKFGTGRGGFEKRSSFDSLSNGDSRRGSFDSLSNGSGADSDSWGRRKTTVEETNGGSGGGGRPKLVLQPRTVPIEAKEAVPKVSPKVTNNPFGAARPREEVLKEKGVDLNEIEKKFESAKVSKEDDKPEVKKGGFGNGWSSDKGAWRKPLSPSAPQSVYSRVEARYLCVFIVYLHLRLPSASYPLLCFLVSVLKKLRKRTTAMPKKKLKLNLKIVLDTCKPGLDRVLKKKRRKNRIFSYLDNFGWGVEQDYNRFLLAIEEYETNNDPFSEHVKVDNRFKFDRFDSCS
ncbi:eukaryotic translation initiation factor 4B3-like [Rutidosis leptorrhynchoides]|uniref:eukaryotic translation initiation factor 4B3-like n=1 Tax=Rutidosis leptorrhynchoides TaxID=125765 RepID=UPI003A992897